MQDESIRTDAEKGVVRCRLVKAGHLGISEERVGPPDAVEHLVADAEFIFVAGTGKVKSRVVPVLTEVEVHREVLRHLLLL